MPLRQQIYALLILLTVGVVCGRILTVQRVYEPGAFREDPGQTMPAVVLPLGASGPLEALVLVNLAEPAWSKAAGDAHRPVWPRARPEPMPTFGSNDRSRWATIRALVDQQTYVIGRRDPSLVTTENKYGDEGICFEDGWTTVDKVMRPDTQEFYSSKPPLLPTLLAGEYWLLKKVFGWSITLDRWKVVKVMLLTVNVLPLIVYLLLLAKLVERIGVTDWARVFVMAAACFGTFLPTFAISLNNHTLAACTTLFALYPLIPPPSPSYEGGVRGGVKVWQASAWRFILAGLFAGFTAVIELPAASFLVLLFVLLLLRMPARTLVCFVPAAAIPVAAALLTNYLAIGQLRPAYSEFGGAWYQYEGSHWHQAQVKKRGLDWAIEKDSMGTYAWHFLLGHHGIFALSPVYLLSVAGMGYAVYRVARRRPEPDSPAPKADMESGLTEMEIHIPDPEFHPSDPEMKLPEGQAPNEGRQNGLWARDGGHTVLAGIALILTAIVLVFYLVVLFWMERGINYGGTSSGPRWLFWLTPLWLVTMLPVVDWLSARRWGRWLAYAMLVVSVVSATYPSWNPWRHPWTYQFMEAQGWIQY